MYKLCINGYKFLYMVLLMFIVVCVFYWFVKKIYFEEKMFMVVREEKNIMYIYVCVEGYNCMLLWIK